MNYQNRKIMTIFQYRSCLIALCVLLILVNISCASEEAMRVIKTDEGYQFYEDDFPVLFYRLKPLTSAEGTHSREGQDGGHSKAGGHRWDDHAYAGRYQKGFSGDDGPSAGQEGLHQVECLPPLLRRCLFLFVNLFSSDPQSGKKTFLGKGGQELTDKVACAPQDLHGIKPRPLGTAGDFCIFHLHP